MSFKSATLFEAIQSSLNDEVCEKVGVVFQFDITSASGETKSWVVDAKSKPGSVKEGSSSEATCTIVMSDDNFVNLLTGKLSGMAAFTSGKMKVKGNVMQTQKLQKLVDPKTFASKL